MGSFIDEGATMASFFVEEHTLPVRLAVFVDLTGVKCLFLNLQVLSSDITPDIIEAIISEIMTMYETENQHSMTSR